MNTQWSRLLFWVVGCWLLISGQAFANVYSKGLEAFRDGEYAKAYKILSAVVKKTKDKSDKAEAMALMGAAAAKMGKRSKATSLFDRALKLDAEVSLPNDALKDKTVRKLFSNAKKGGGGNVNEDEPEKKTAKGSIDNMTFIPFGVGHIMKGDLSKGLLYGGAQVAGVLGFMYYRGEIAKANADADTIGQDALARKAAGQQIDQETLDFLDQNEAFVKAAQNNQKLMLAIAGAGYALGIADSVFFGSSKSSSKKPGKRRAERLLLTPAELLAESSPATPEDLATRADEPMFWGMGLHLLPQSDPALMLSINRSF